MTLKLAAVLSLSLVASALSAANSASAIPSPALLVLNKEDATLAIVDPTTGKVTGLIPTGEGPHEVVASTDGQFAFATNYGGTTPGNTISMIDLTAQKEVRRIDTTPLRRPHGLAFADGKLYFTAELNRLIARYDPAADKVDFLLGTGQTTTHMIMVNPSATRIVTANIGGNSIAVFERGANPTANWNETVVPVGQAPEGFDVSPDGKEIWAAHSRDGGVSVIDAATKKVVATLDFKTRQSNRLKFTPDGRIVLISDLVANQLVVIDAATRAEVKRIPTGQRPLGILMAPDGLRAYVAINTDHYVSIVDLKSLTITGKIETGKGPDGMAWVPAR